MWVVSANTQFVTISEKTISGVHVSPDNAEILVTRGGITNQHSIALSATSLPNYLNRFMCVEVTVCNISVAFKDTMYIDACRWDVWLGSRRTPLAPDIAELGELQAKWCSISTSWMARGPVGVLRQVSLKGVHYRCVWLKRDVNSVIGRCVV